MTISTVLNMLLAGVASVLMTIGSDTAFAAESEYRLGPGDRVKVVVFGHENLSGEYEVGNEGRLSLPLIRSIPASGRTVQEIETAITGKLQPDYLKNPRVGVVIVEYRPFYILGEVQNPGSYPYRANTTVVTAVALAGGYTEQASKNKVYIVRASDPERKKVRVDRDTTVLPGDVIEVSESFF